MTPITRILVATDLSAPSMHAVDRAYQIAGRTRAHVTLVNALGLDALGPLRNVLGLQADEVARTLIERRTRALEDIAAEPARRKTIDTAIVVEPGLAARTVPARAAACDADLVVLGARGEGTLRRFLLGSTASHVLRKTPRPVLIVKRACRTPYRRILVGIDFSPVSERLVRLAADIAPGAALHLLHVLDVPFEGLLSYAGVEEEVVRHYRTTAKREAVQGLHDLAARAGLTRGDYAVSVLPGHGAETIRTQAEHARCDLVVLGKHGTHVTEELLLGSVTKHLIDESRSDVLVVVDERALTATLG